MTPNPVRVLVVTDQPAVSPPLLEAIRARATRAPAQFRMLVPDPAPAEWHPMHPERHAKAADAERVLAASLPSIEQAAGSSVIGSVSIRHDAMDAIEEALLDEPFDEVLLAVAPHGILKRLHVDLPRRVAHLGLVVTTVGEQQPGATPSV